jgi:DNA helicase-2/ATP-dependent DNA helicase PcrA
MTEHSSNSTALVKPEYLERLNAPQREAVEKTEGPLLVLAGAGTGKTRVLTSRVVHILNLGLARPFEILAVTFTNKAALEMKERIHLALGQSLEGGLWLGTFHSLGLKILRRYAEDVDLNPHFSILDPDDQIRLLKQLLKLNHIDEKKTPAKMVSIIISRWKDRAIRYDQVPISEQGVISNIYEQYQKRLHLLNAVDFGDLLLHCLTLFQKHPSILEQYQRQFRYIHVDEYQDTNIAQYMWVRLLSGHHKNLCCVGDDDQSIYGWRGAEVGNILKFEKDFPNTYVVKLEQNYRSTSHIIKTAAKLISHNKERLSKTLWTEQVDGEKVIIRATWDSDDEARFICTEIEDLTRKGVNLQDTAILVRAGFQTRSFEERFLRMGIPYKVIGGFRFYERQEIRDAIAYIRLIVQPDDGMAFERIINLPKRGIGGATIQKIHEISRLDNISVPKAAFLYAQNSATGQVKLNILNFFSNIARWRNMLENNTPHVDVIKLMLDESGYASMWANDQSTDAPGRLENLKELVSAIEEFDYLQGFLEHVSLVMENNQKKLEDQVTIMSLHAAKGLEYDYVYLSGWEEKLFPHSKSLDENGQEGLEEERRLGYVGISRAKKRAVITHTKQRKMYSGWNKCHPSRFLKELPLENITIYSANGVLQKDKSHLNDDFIPIESSYTSIGNDFALGDRIFHKTFGYGSITDKDGEYVVVQFDTGHIKQIIASFVEHA